MIFLRILAPNRAVTPSCELPSFCERGVAADQSDGTAYVARTLMAPVRAFGPLARAGYAYPISRVGVAICYHAASSR
jgi:hypothetical protein